MKKLLSVICIFALCVSALAFAGCGEEPAPEVDISEVAEVLTDDGVSYAYAEVEKASATDLGQLQTWYQEYYKPMRDDGDIVALIVRYSDDPEHATFFTGVNVYTMSPCDDDNNCSMKEYEKWYRTGSHDGMLSEVTDE